MLADARKNTGSPKRGPLEDRLGMDIRDQDLLCRLAVDFDRRRTCT